MSLSIIIPHFNKNQALEETWKELLLQINPNDQILIVDDHSDVKPEFDCPCTETIQPPKRTPHIYRLNTLRNYGLEHAKHDFCIILDPDCIPNPKFLDNARKMCDASILFAGCIEKIQKDGSIKPDGRTNSNSSMWVDQLDKDGGPVYGGCMMFSKSRTELIGWFDTAYDGVWGAEDADFGARCYHSGMRIRFSMELKVTHQWHEKKTEGYQRNRKMWIEKSEGYRNHMNVITPYKPSVGVMVITMMRPDLIDQCLQSIFRNRIPLKVRLINNGDDGEDTRRICQQWGRRWAVDYVHHPRKWPAQVRNDSMRWAKEKGYKYLIFVDDDMVVSSNGLVNLVNSIEKNPEYYAVSGSLMHSKNAPRKTLGGPLYKDAFYNYPSVNGTCESDWVGGGFTVHKLDPLIPYDESYQTGYNDFDWSMIVKERGLKLGVTGDAYAYHAYKVTNKGFERYRNPPEYTRIRYDHERHKRMNQLFQKKWGFLIGSGGVWKQ